MIQDESFTPGQRWISDAESELGLGTVLANNGRQVTLVFMFSGETRIYSIETAPLTRVQFGPGDRVESHDGWFLNIMDVEQSDGILIYRGRRDNGEHATLAETSLSNFIRLNKPQERLLSGQLDDNKWFELRAQTYNNLHNLSHSSIRGLRGARIDLIPHQIYIAKEIGSRLAPRALLADEVGLGKTIEAGLILHYQLLREEINRVLIVVPEPLLHQWLVEMLRRFSLRFSILDSEKYQSIKTEAGDINPFASEQLVLCSLPFLVSQPHVWQDALDAGWDTLVVDEAHHLGWHQENVSKEYKIVEKLTRICPSVLLLTATPEQLGLEGHFARLRLLDSDRFGNLPRFMEESSHFRHVADLAALIQDNHSLDTQSINTLAQLVGEDFLRQEQWKLLTKENDPALSDMREDLLDRMIDQHGTGRLLFRNTRAAIRGFPKRQFHYHELPKGDLLQVLCHWLNGFLRNLYPKKSLMICSSSTKVLEMAEVLRVRFGIHAAVFHEYMSIVERDRAAAWFANPEDDCLLMISSEIGSEGRNFQFLHHLILHEIPENPDLLEQRIGRLDRIGQNADIQIHVPCQSNSIDHKLTRWYHEGLNAFEKTCSTGAAIAQELAAEMEMMLSADADENALINLIKVTQTLREERNQQLEKGRDRLLELNSNRPEKIASLLEALRLADTNPDLPEFMRNLFDHYGVDFEEQSDNSWIVRPGRHMSVSRFPGIPDEGVTLTFDRKSALAREDLAFLTWDHPIVTGAIDLVVSGTFGQACIAITELKSLPHAALYLEALFRIECTVGQDSNLRHYLPAETLRLVIDESGRNFSESLSHATIADHIHLADKSQTSRFIKSRTNDIKTMIESACKQASGHLPDSRLASQHSIEADFGAEIARLKHLQTINPLIKDQEIIALENRRDGLLGALEGVTTNLVALRLLVNIH